MLFAGGSFGRRANPVGDYVVEAASIAKALARRARRHPGQARLDARGRHDAAATTGRLPPHAQGRARRRRQRRRAGSTASSASRSSPARRSSRGMVKDGIDATSVEGAATLPYAIPNLHVDLHSPTDRRAGAVVALGRLDAHRLLRPRPSSTSWRSRGRQGSGRVPPRAAREAPAPPAACSSSRRRRPAGARRSRRQGRREARPRHRRARVVQHLRRAGRRGHGRKDSDVQASTAWSARSTAASRSIPDNVRAQMEGGIGFGLSAALYGAITLKDGAVEQSNFHDYPVLRIDEMPKVEVHIVPSTDKPDRRRRAGRAADRPAVANALAAATGKRLRNCRCAAGPTARHRHRGCRNLARAILIASPTPARARPCRAPRIRRADAFASCTPPAAVRVLPDTRARLRVRASEAAGRRPRDAPAIPTLGELARGRLAGPDTLPRRARRYACVARHLADDAPAPSGCATPACARCSSRCPSRCWRSPRARSRSSSGTAPTATAAAAARRRATSRRRARQGVPGLRPLAYPRVSPAMMVLVTRGRELLLARATASRPAMYSALAGFVEPGETIEDCIRREVREEVGVEVARHPLLRAASRGRSRTR